MNRFNPAYLAILILLFIFFSSITLLILNNSVSAKFKTIWPSAEPIAENMSVPTTSPMPSILPTPTSTLPPKIQGDIDIKIQNNPSPTSGTKTYEYHYDNEDGSVSVSTKSTIETNNSEIIINGEKISVE